MNHTTSTQTSLFFVLRYEKKIADDDHFLLIPKTNFE